MGRGDTLASQAIRVALLHERRQPDVFYSENSVVTMLGVLRTPAPEALRQLDIEGLDRTARMIASLRGVLMGTRIVQAETRRTAVVIAEHAGILAALELRDANAVVAAITRHIRKTAEAASSSAESVRA
jgi:DNA-binding GntR family transcriptional regulator